MRHPFPRYDDASLRQGYGRIPEGHEVPDSNVLQMNLLQSLPVYRPKNDYETHVGQVVPWPSL